MNVIKHGTGKFTDYSLDGTKFTASAGTIHFDLAGLEDDDAVHIDICADQNGNVVEGVSFRYVAQLDIPPRISKIEKTGRADDMGIPEVRKTTAPFDSENVTLTLWALDE
jgi:hypothetical protein